MKATVLLKDVVDEMDKALHQTAIPLHSIATGELGRSTRFHQ